MLVPIRKMVHPEFTDRLWFIHPVTKRWVGFLELVNLKLPIERVLLQNSIWITCITFIDEIKLNKRWSSFLSQRSWMISWWSASLLETALRRCTMASCNLGDIQLLPHHERKEEKISTRRVCSLGCSSFISSPVNCEIWQGLAAVANIWQDSELFPTS
jgi:hypothetical protein